ncbi:MAG TPA: M48 family metalloprotease [Candidatus Acidoferrum sp.]|nr:M48 family metalloprotease [Candidatus Acidoferrum sp.]
MFAIVVLLLSPIANSQSACPPLQAPPVDPAKLLFSPQQEQELGEVIRQQLESEFLVIDEDQVTRYLKRVGERVARNLPETGLHYEFLLYDRPEIQAFGMPGGRVYVSRKMVAYLRNENELAGVLGHELGHLAARQQAQNMSRMFREVLGLKTLAPDEDLYGLYNQFMESVRLKKIHAPTSGESDKGQQVADQLGVQAVARAGYAPQSFPDFLDRLMETKGKTGSWLSDLFGATNPNSKRLREALRDVANLPSNCIEKSPPQSDDDFHQWQTAVLHYHGIGHAEHLAGVVTRSQLQDPLRGDIETFRFSPDGKYLLAQDEGGIYILTRDPFKYVFRIDSVDAQAAQFSLDSRQVLFFSSGLQVETWDIDRQEQTSVMDVPVLRGCRQTELSPDAKYLACFGGDLSLTLFNVPTGEIVYKKEKFYDFDPGFSGYGGLFKFIYLLTHQEVATLRFSPDARYFAASSRTKEEVVIDLTTEKPINVGGPVHTAMEYAFTFVGPNRLIGVDTGNPQKSPLVEFPSGKVLDRVSLGGSTLVAAANPKYILMRPVEGFAVAGFDLDAKKFAFTNRMSATDVWGDLSASERLNGEIGLYKVGGTQSSSVLQLPLGKLGTLRTFLASPDLKWMALSSRTRGGVWGLDSGQRTFLVRSFQNAYYAPNNLFYLDFPEFEKAGREMVVLSPVSKQSKSRPVEKDDDLSFFGSMVLRTKHHDKNQHARRNFELEALDMVTLKTLWSRTFPKEGPWVSGSASSGRIIFVWQAHAIGLREELSREPKLQTLWNQERPADTDYLLEVLDSHDGTVAGGAVVHTGKYSFRPEHQDAAADWLIVTDDHNRVLLYSISTGEQKAKWFGYNPKISRNGDRLCLANGRGHLVLYDLRSLKQIGELSFANRLSAFTLSDDAARLLVLTNDQCTYVFDVTGNSATAASTR